MSDISLHNSHSLCFVFKLEQYLHSCDYMTLEDIVSSYRVHRLLYTLSERGMALVTAIRKVVATRTYRL